MNDASNDQALALLEAHCASFDPDTATARERLDDVLGPELARKLVFALSSGRHSRARSRSALSAHALFAA